MRLLFFAVLFSAAVLRIVKYDPPGMSPSRQLYERLFALVLLLLSIGGMINS